MASAEIFVVLLQIKISHDFLKLKIVLRCRTEVKKFLSWELIKLFTYWLQCFYKIEIYLYSMEIIILKSSAGHLRCSSIPRLPVFLVKIRIIAKTETFIDDYRWLDQFNNHCVRKKDYYVHITHVIL